MKKASLLILVGLASFASADLRSEINTMNAKVRACMMKLDMDGFVKLVKPGVTKDFKYSENGKSMNFDQMVATMRQSFATMKKVTAATTKTLALKVTGNTGVATSAHSMSVVTMGPDKKSHTMTFTGTSSDHYRNENGTWKMSSMTWKNDKMLMDGKPMDMSKMGNAKSKD